MSDRTTAALARVWPVLFLVAVPLGLFAPILFDHYTLYPVDALNELYLPFAAGRTGLDVQTTTHLDFVRHYLPQRMFLAEQLRAGELPLWNPFIRGGFPQFAAQGSIVTLDPFNVLFVVMDLPHALAWRTFGQVACCGLFAFLYFRALGLARLAAWAGAQGLALNSMFYATVFDWSPGSLLWWPLILYCLERARGGSRVRWTAAASLATGFALLSSPLQLGAYCLFTVAALEGVRALTVERRGAARAAGLAAVTTALVLGLLIASVQLLPAAELVTYGRRLSGSDVSEGLGQWTLRILGLVTFVFPNLAGRMKDGLRLSEAWGSGHFFQGYFGFLPIVFAAMALVAWRDRRRWPFAVVGGVALALTFTPLRVFLYDRLLIVSIFCGAALAAYGLDAVLRREVDPARAALIERSFLGLTAATAGVLTAGTVLYAAFREPIDTWADRYLASVLPGRYLGYALPLYLQKLHETIAALQMTSVAMAVPLGLAAIGLILVGAWHRHVLSSLVFQGGCVALVVVDLLTTVMVQVGFVDYERHPFLPANGLIDRVRDEAGGDRVATLRWNTLEPLVIRANLWAAYGVHALDGDDNFRPLDVSSIGQPPEAWRGVDPAVNPALLGLQNVRYVAVSASRAIDDDGFELRYVEDGVAVYENLSVMPRVFVVSKYEVVPDAQDALRRLNAPHFDPRTLVLLDRLPAGALHPRYRRVATDAGSGDRTSTAAIVRHTPREVDILARLDSPGLVVLSDTYYPGWTATLDGADVPVLRANAAMRAVAVGAGEHDLAFRFEPPLARTGGRVSVATGVLTTALFLLWPRRFSRR